ncbi:hypothetical protein Pst134EB_014160 [Puccinia striiformis f. sp. tritici]|nr:hypothetical protein Pst134EB_014160 [Puccinia striiformis f. sp. tritici]
MLQITTNTPPKPTNRILAPHCSSIRPNGYPLISPSASSPEAPKTPSSAQTSHYCDESPRAVSSTSASSSNWSSPCTLPRSSPLRPAQLGSAPFSKIAVNLSASIGDLLMHSHSHGNFGVTMDSPSNEPFQDAFFAPFCATESGNPMAVAPHVVSDVHPDVAENPIIQCLRDLHLLQTPLRVAFQEVFDCLSDEVFDPSTQPTDYADDKVTNDLNAPLSLPPTPPLNHPDSNDEPPVIRSSRSRTHPSAQGLKDSPPLTYPSKMPCSLVRRPAKVRRSTRDKKTIAQTVCPCAKLGVSFQPKVPQSLIFDRSFIHETSNFKFWNSILEGPPLTASALNRAQKSVDLAP